MYIFKIYRNCDSFRLRKVNIELYFVGEGQPLSSAMLINKKRSFAIFPKLFAKRLERKKMKMLELAEIMLKASGKA